MGQLSYQYTETSTGPHCLSSRVLKINGPLQFILAQALKISYFMYIKYSSINSKISC